LELKISISNEIRRVGDGARGERRRKKAEIRNGIYVSTVRSTVEDCYKTFVVIL